MDSEKTETLVPVAEQQAELSAAADGDGKVLRSMEEITKDVQQAVKDIDKNFLKLGNLLSEAKQQLTAHGKWLAWLHDNVPFTSRTAERYILAAHACSNSTALSNLGMTKILALMQIVDEAEREKFIAESHEIGKKQLRVDEMSTRQVQKAVSYITKKPVDSNERMLNSIKSMTKRCGALRNDYEKAEDASAVREMCRDDVLTLIKEASALAKLMGIEIGSESSAE